MPSEQGFTDQIARMLSEGTPSGDEAQRLRAMLVEQSDHAAAASRAIKAPARLGGRLASLLALLMMAFALGVASVSLVSAPVEVSAPAPEVHERETPVEGRLIDLSKLDAERTSTMNRGMPILIGVIPVTLFAVLGLALVLIHNGLVGAREQVNAGWAQVENVYQRRLDLVPVLVDAVQTYTDHERSTLAELTEARASALQLSGALGGATPETVDQLKAIEASQGKVEASLARLLAVVESYPDLKASRNFLSLQDQLEGTENRVAMERRHYNEFSRRYNTRLQTFPTNVVARMMGFESKPYFEAQASALDAPKDPFGRRQS